MRLDERLWREGPEALAGKDKKQNLRSVNVGAACEKSGESRTVNAEECGC